MSKKETDFCSKVIMYMSVILITERLVCIIECLCFEGVMVSASGRDFGDKRFGDSQQLKFDFIPCQ